MSRCSPVSTETGRHVKNNACDVEIKIKWMIRKHMTYDNTWHTKTHDIRKHMTYENTWRTKTHDARKHMTHENTWRTKHMTYENTWRTKTHDTKTDDIRKHMRHENTWPMILFWRVCRVIGSGSLSSAYFQRYRKVLINLMPIDTIHPKLIHRVVQLVTTQWQFHILLSPPAGHIRYLAGISTETPYSVKCVLILPEQLQLQIW